MNYQETIEFIYSKLPSLEKKGWGAYQPGLERIEQQLAQLNDPQNAYPIVHVAGTNGKGSVSNLLASVLQEAGLKVGLFTSPHLKDFRERIRINGKVVPEQYVVDFVAAFSEVPKALNPSFFEYTFAMAMAYFQEQKVDVVVLETGLGGRLDCTNVVHPILSIITNVAMDHEQFLGTTLKAIAAEKAGIIKKDTEVIVGRKQEEIATVFESKAIAENAVIFYAEEAKYPSGLTGACQNENQATVLKAVERLNAKGYGISEIDVQKGLLNVLQNTGLQGRFQVLQDQPLIVCDVAHNVDGIQQLMKQIEALGKKQVHIVWGMSSDKKVNEILKLLPLNAKYYWCSAVNQRSLAASELSKQGNKMGLKGQVYSSTITAFEGAKKELQSEDLLLVAGSVFVVAEVL